MNLGNQQLPLTGNWLQIWKSTLHPRHKLLIWRILTESLATKDRLKKIMLFPHLICDICGQKEESMTHLLIECPFIMAVWVNSPWQLRLDRLNPPSLAAWIFDILNIKPKGIPYEIYHDRFLHFTAVAWENVWRIRNEARTSQVQLDWGDVCCKINSADVSYWTASFNRCKAMTRRASDSWVPPLA